MYEWFFGVISSNLFLGILLCTLVLLVLAYLLYVLCHKIFAEQLKNFGDYIAGRGEFIITCNAAKKDGGLAESFFKNIGTVDIFTQKEALKSYKTQFDERLKICAAEEKDKGMMMLKVFTLAGLAAGILLM